MLFWELFGTVYNAEPGITACLAEMNLRGTDDSGQILGHESKFAALNIYNIPKIEKPTLLC